MRLMYKKSRNHRLMFCQVPGCKVITFIDQDRCPSCKIPGRLIRDPLGPVPAPRPYV
jgi:hypothetical protein